MAELELRALMPADAGAVRALVMRQLGTTRYESRVLEELDDALAFDDPEYIARKLVVKRVGNPEIGPVEVIGRLIDFSDTPIEPGWAPPVMWQHTREILRELGYSDADIDKLGETGVVVLPQRTAEPSQGELVRP